MTDIECFFYKDANTLERYWMDGCGEGYKRGICGLEDLSEMHLRSENEQERNFGKGMAYGYVEGALMAQRIESVGIPL